jgi:hypothetical protein
MKQAYVFLFCAIALCSFKGHEIKPLPNGSIWIPADFDADKTTLLIEGFQLTDKKGNAVGNSNAARAYEKVTEKYRVAADQYYPFKYVVATKKDIETNTKYADKDVYRWVLESITTYGSSISLTGGGASTSYSTDFRFYDRKNDKIYKFTGMSYGYADELLKRVLVTIVSLKKEEK